MLITGIHCLGHVMPLAGEQYAIARVTSADGTLPNELTERMYQGTGTPWERLSVAPSELGYEDSILENSIALFVLVKQVAVEGGEVSFKIIQSIDEFLSPFDFSEDVVKSYREFYTGKRSEDAALNCITFTLDDDEEGTHTPCIGWVNGIERYYLDRQATYMEENPNVGPAKPSHIINAQQISQVRSNTPISMLFAEMLNKVVDLYNGIHYFNKADDVARIIADIKFINESGEKGNLNFTAVEKFFSNVKDRLLVGENVAKPVVRVNED